MISTSFRTENYYIQRFDTYDGDAIQIDNSENLIILSYQRLSGLIDVKEDTV